MADSTNCPWGQQGMLSWRIAGNATKGVVHSICVSRAAVLTHARMHTLKDGAGTLFACLELDCHVERCVAC